MLIGIDLDVPALTAALDSCLVTPSEIAGVSGRDVDGVDASILDGDSWTGVGGLVDPFAIWPPLRMLLDDDGDSDVDEEEGNGGDGVGGEEDGDEDGDDEPVGVIDVVNGGSDLQETLDYADAPLAVVHWSMPSAAAPGPRSVAAGDDARIQLESLAERYRPRDLLVLQVCGSRVRLYQVAYVGSEGLCSPPTFPWSCRLWPILTQVDVEASEANMALAMQQGLWTRPTSRRAGARPVLAAGRVSLSNFLLR